VARGLGITHRPGGSCLRLDLDQGAEITVMTWSLHQISIIVINNEIKSYG
jgi:hypothetical protein